ncbi:MAG: hypothetical protein IPO27_01740 [Bacteroidetes bacterium]|nr:hypothetical protein [Bacteroidota bacterium]
MIKKYIALCILTCVQIFYYGCQRNHAEVHYTTIELNSACNFYSMHKDSTGAIYVCGGNQDRGVIYKSTDYGHIWKVYSDSYSKQIYDFAILQDGNLIASSGDLELLYSTTKGKGWKQVIPSDRPKTGHQSEMYKISRAPDGAFYFCGGEKLYDGVIYYTTDTLRTLGFAHRNHEIRSMHWLGNHAIAVGYGAILYSETMNNDWQFANAPDDFYTGSTSHKNIFYSCSFNGGIYQSYDFGKNWNCINGKNRLTGKRFFYNCMALQNQHGVALGNDGSVATTSNYGTSWNEAYSFDNADINCVINVYDNLWIAAGDDGKIFRFSF